MVALTFIFQVTIKKNYETMFSVAFQSFIFKKKLTLTTPLENVVFEFKCCIWVTNGITTRWPHDLGGLQKLKCCGEQFCKYFKNKFLLENKTKYYLIIVINQHKICLATSLFNRMFLHSIANMNVEKAKPRS